jgi:signal transduction histidine kinase
MIQRRSFSELVEQAPFGVAIYAPSGRLTFLNIAQQKRLGVTPEILGTLLNTYNILEDPQLIDSGSMATIERGFAGAVVKLPPLLYQPTLVQAVDRGPLWLETTVFPIKDEQGEVKEVAVVFEDVTDRRRVESEREAIRRRSHQAHTLETLGTLATGVAHDFNNTLAPMGFYLELLRKENLDQSERLDAVTRLEICLERATALVRRIKMSVSSTPGERRPTNLVALLHEAVEFTRSALPSSIQVDLRVKQDGVYSRKRCARTLV